MKPLAPDMLSRKTNTDYEFAQRLCNELRGGNREALLELYHRYHHFFAAFARKRLFEDHPDHVEDLLSNFWIELLNDKVVCSYQGRSSLRTYLTVILNRRIIDANRKFDRERNSLLIIKEQEDESRDENSCQTSPEKEVMEKEQRTLIDDALKQLSEVSARDANLIRMHLEGLSYEQMAKMELSEDQTDSVAIRKKTAAIKKQFTRNETGSMAKFRRILNRSLDTHALELKDILN